MQGFILDHHRFNFTGEPHALYVDFAFTVYLCIASAEDVSRDVPAFNTIRSRSAFNVTVEVGKAQSITIRGNDKFTGKVVTEVFGNELLISYKEKFGADC
jgi:hypothetical protein